MALSRRFPRYWVGGFMRYDTLAGAVFENSPLVKRSSTVSAGVAVTWVFSESSKLVDVTE
jgi:outer membrane scaffolding protein for murein synthesis (MipA/OmpV family)